MNGSGIVEECLQCDDCPLSVFNQDEDLDRLRSLIRILRRHQPSIIYEEGDSATDGFFICRGEIVLFKRTERGGGIILQNLTKGDIFGVKEILSDQEAYLTSARAPQETLLVALPREELLHLLKTSLPFCFEITQRLTDYSLLMQQKFATFVEKSLAQRLALTLSQLSQQYGENREGAIEIARPLTNQELAEMIGTTPETVSALLGTLKEKSIVERHGRTFLIRKPAELRQMG